MKRAIFALALALAIPFSVQAGYDFTTDEGVEAFAQCLVSPTCVVDVEQAEIERNDVSVPVSGTETLQFKNGVGLYCNPNCVKIEQARIE